MCQAFERGLLRSTLTVHERIAKLAVCGCTLRRRSLIRCDQSQTAQIDSDARLEQILGWER
jgi:hypothetical protein